MSESKETEKVPEKVTEKVPELDVRKDQEEVDCSSVSSN